MKKVREVISNNTMVADKSIVAICLLHIERKQKQLETGKNITGMGPNRDDAPIFYRLIDKYIHKNPIKKDDLFKARHRVGKYARQLRESSYWTSINDPNFTHDMMLEQYSAKVSMLRADTELMEFLKEDADYGNW